MNISDRLRKRRKELGMTQTELALKVGVTQQAINSVENGLSKKPKFIIELARALKCSAEWLYDGG